MMSFNVLCQVFVYLVNVIFEGVCREDTCTGHSRYQDRGHCKDQSPYFFQSVFLLMDYLHGIIPHILLYNLLTNKSIGARLFFE